MTKDDGFWTEKEMQQSIDCGAARPITAADAETISKALRAEDAAMKYWMRWRFRWNQVCIGVSWYRGGVPVVGRRYIDIAIMPLPFISFEIEARNW